MTRWQFDRRKSWRRCVWIGVAMLWLGAAFRTAGYFYFGGACLMTAVVFFFLAFVDY